MPYYSNFENYQSNQSGGASRRGCTTNFECFKLDEESNDRYFARNFAVQREPRNIKLVHPIDSILSERYKTSTDDTINYTTMFKDNIDNYKETNESEIEPTIADLIEKQSFLNRLENTTIKDIKFNSDQEIVDYVKQKMFFHDTFFEISDNIAKDKNMFNNPTRAVNQD